MGTTVEACLTCDSSDIESSPAIWMPFISHRALDLPPLTIDSDTGLTNIQHGVSYALCKSLMCRQCGHLFVDYRFSETEMSRLYTDYRGEIYEISRDTYEPGYASMNKTLRAGLGTSYLSLVEDFLRDLVPASDLAVLDWGGDTGINTPFPDRRSLLHIYDPSAADTGITNAVTFSEIPAEKLEYDLVVLSHVLEHIPYPGNTLEELRNFMTSKTVLYVEVPLERVQRDADGPPYTGAYRKKHWHEHINFFTPRSLQALVSNSGLRVISLKVLDNTSWQENSVASALNVIQLACVLK